MKKIILIFAVGLFLFSCQHEEVETFNNDESLTSKKNIDNVLSFESKEAYEQLFTDKKQLNAKLANANFVSMASKIAKYNEALEREKTTVGLLKDDTDLDYEDYGILPTILNEDRIVKIGKHYIKVDLPQERVLVLDDDYTSEYQDLLQDNIENEHIQLFSTGENVLNLLAKNEPSEIFKKCDADRARSGNASIDYRFSRRKRVRVKVRYQRAGIIFRLLAEGKAQKRRLGIWWHDGGRSFNLVSEHNFGKRCGKTANGFDITLSDHGRAKLVLYNGFVALEYYELTAAMQYGVGTVTIQSNI